MDTLRVEPPAMALALSASFGSVDGWHADLVTTAQSAATGQVVLGFAPGAGRLVHLHVPAGSAPPAGHQAVWSVDLPADLAFPTIDWAAVYELYQHAVHRSSEAFAANPLDLGDALVLDVRRDAPFQQAKTVLPGATWRNPAQVGTWAADLPRGRAVVVYCIYGHEVGRSTAMRLRAEGVNACFLPGGIDAWEKAGQPVVPRSEAQ